MPTWLSIAATLSRYEGFVLMERYLGPRWGELAGLKRQHLQLLMRQPLIVGSLERDGNRFLYIEQTKTVNARRTLPLPPFLVDAFAAPLGTHGSDFVFPAPDGGPLHYQNFPKRILGPCGRSIRSRTVHPTRPPAHLSGVDD